MTTACVFCLSSGELVERQVLWRGTHLYLCAPRGQLVEGCLVIAPFECVGCFARAPASYLEELAALQALVARFYAGAYGVERPSFYEQGRAGGGAATDALGGFPHHAHLCCLPLQLDLHPLLREHAAVPVDGPEDATTVSRGRPYVYVDAVGRRAVYVPVTPEGHRALAELRLTSRIATLIGLRGHDDWRRHSVDEVLERVAVPFQRALNGVT